MTTTIQVNGIDRQIRPGLVAVEDLYQIAKEGGERLFLSRDDDIDIPLSPSEHLVVRGGERFVLGASAIEDNPPVRNPVQPEFNGLRELSFSRAKVTGAALLKEDPDLPTGRLFVDIDTGVDVEIPSNMTIVLQDADSYFVIPASSDADASLIDIEECSLHDRPPPKGKKYRIRIDRGKHRVDSTEITGAAILSLVDKTPTEWSLNQKLHGGKRIRIAPEEVVNLAQPGIERFETVPKQAQQGQRLLWLSLEVPPE